MAKKQRVPQTSPANEHPAEVRSESAVLPKGQFNNIIRCLIRGDVSRALAVRSASFAVLKELGVARDLDLVVTTAPKGSDQFDGGSLISWMRRVRKDDRRALRQLLQIDATACSRGT